MTKACWTFWRLGRSHWIWPGSLCTTGSAYPRQTAPNARPRCSKCPCSRPRLPTGGVEHRHAGRVSGLLDPPWRRWRISLTQQSVKKWHEISFEAKKDNSPMLKKSDHMLLFARTYGVVKKIAFAFPLKIGLVHLVDKYLLGVSLFLYWVFFFFTGPPP